jgi:TolB protein
MNPRALVLLLTLAYHGAQADERGGIFGTLQGWVRAMPGLGGKKAEEPPQKIMTRVRVTPFTGGTGSSAESALQKELLASREFFVAGPDEKADFTLGGSSSGGRVNGRLMDVKGKEVFLRTYAAPGLDENLKAFADDVIFTITGRPGLATSRIVFVSDRSGRRQIYLCNADGGEVNQVTHDRHGAVSPTLSPDSSLVAFTGYSSGFPVVNLLDLHAGWERGVTDTPGTSFGAAFSPDGTHLAVVMSFIGNPEIFVSDLNTNTASCISDSIGAPASPSWHPEGKQIVFSNDDGNGPKLNIIEVPQKEGDPSRLFRWRTGYHFCTDPEWSPDGRQIAFTTRKSGEWAVAIKPYPNGSSRIIQGGGAQHPSWSPNGQFITYVQHGGLFVHEVRSGHRRQILKGYGRISEPRWMR